MFTETVMMREMESSQYDKKYSAFCPLCYETYIITVIFPSMNIKKINACKHLQEVDIHIRNKAVSNKQEITVKATFSGDKLEYLFSSKDEAVRVFAALEQGGNLDKFIQNNFPQYLLPDGTVAKFSLLEDLEKTFKK